jgi:hypothetical protein
MSHLILISIIAMITSSLNVNQALPVQERKGFIDLLKPDQNAKQSSDDIIRGKRSFGSKFFANAVRESSQKTSERII